MALDDLLSEIRSTTPNALGANNLAHGEVVDQGNDAQPKHVGQESSHDLLLEQGTPGDITAATQQDQGENHFAEGQEDDSTKADESDLLDHGLTFVSHGVPLDTGHNDTDAADLFLEALGFGRHEPVFLSAGGKDFWCIPRKPKDGYDWEQVTAQAANGRDWSGFLRLLKERPNACFQSCIGGTTNDEITGGWLLVYEIDNYPKDQQYGLWETAGLPDPTLVMDTGNDSLHVWYRLDAHYESEDISDGRERLAAAISEVFKIVNTNVLEAAQRRQLQAIRAHLDRLEDGGSQVIDI